MNLLIFFAFPFATIILAIVLEKIIENPVLVSLTFFAIYLILAFSIFTIEFLVAAIIYGIIAFIVAKIYELCKRFFRKKVEINCNIETVNNNIENVNNNITNIRRNGTKFCRRCNRIS